MKYQLAFILLGFSSLMTGCGSSTSISGEVTFNSDPVDGMITFVPTDGEGQPAGGKIVNGKYRIDKISPGPKMVQIHGIKNQAFPTSQGDVPKGKAASVNPIPKDAVGNNAKVVIKAGSQTFDFHLKSKKKSPR